MPSKPNNVALLENSLEQEDRHLDERFARAESVLLRPTAKLTTATTRKRSVRETLSMTKEDLARIAKLRERSFSYSVPANKSEIVRAGLCLLEMVSEENFRKAMAAIERL